MVTAIAFVIINFLRIQIVAEGIARSEIALELDLKFSNFWLPGFLLADKYHRAFSPICFLVLISHAPKIDCGKIADN